MSENFGPERWAIDISKILNVVLGQNHFPIRVAEVAQEIARNKYPDDPIAAFCRASEGLATPARAHASEDGLKQAGIATADMRPVDDPIQ